MSKGEDSFFEEDIARYENCKGFQVQYLPTLLIVWISKEDTTATTRSKLVAFLRICNSITEASKKPKMVICRGSEKQNFMWSFGIENIARSAINKMSGCEDTFSPQLERKIGLKA